MSTKGKHTCEASRSEMDRKLCNGAVVVGSCANADAASVKRTATRENMVRGMIVVRWLKR